MKSQQLFYSSESLLEGVKDSQLVAQNVRTKDGVYSQIVVPKDTIIYRGIYGKDCYQDAIQAGDYGKWYGSIPTATRYMNTKNGSICAVQFKRSCKLLNMTDENTKKLLVSRFAQQGGHYDDALQHMVARAFAIRNLSYQKKPKFRQSIRQNDEDLVLILCQLFPQVDGYVFVSHWSQNPREDFLDEIYLCQPDTCLSLLKPKFQKQLLNECLEKLLLMGRKVNVGKAMTVLKHYFRPNATFNVSENVRHVIQQLIDSHTSFRVSTAIGICFLFQSPNSVIFDDDFYPISIVEGWTEETLTKMFHYLCIKHESVSSILNGMNPLLLDSHWSMLVNAINHFTTTPSFFHELVRFFFWQNKTTFGKKILLSWNDNQTIQLFYIPQMSKTDWYNYIAFLYYFSYHNDMLKQKWGDHFNFLSDIIYNQYRNKKIPQQVQSQQQQINQNAKKFFDPQQNMKQFLKQLGKKK